MCAQSSVTGVRTRKVQWQNHTASAHNTSTRGKLVCTSTESTAEQGVCSSMECVCVRVMLIILDLISMAINYVRLASLSGMRDAREMNLSVVYFIQ